jgi:hypothetical protein
VTTLYTEDIPAPVVFMLAHLSALGAVGQTRIETDPMPFREVNVVNTAPDSNLFYADCLASVHTFHWARTPQERADALDHAKETDRRIMLLGNNPLTDVTMPDATIANCEYLDVVEKSILRPYGVNTIHRYVGRFRYGLSFVAV